MGLTHTQSAFGDSMNGLAGPGRPRARMAGWQEEARIQALLREGLEVCGSACRYTLFGCRWRHCVSAVQNRQCEASLPRDASAPFAVTLLIIRWAATTCWSRLPTHLVPTPRAVHAHAVHLATATSKLPLWPGGASHPFQQRFRCQCSLRTHTRSPSPSPTARFRSSI